MKLAFLTAALLLLTACTPAPTATSSPTFALVATPTRRPTQQPTATPILSSFSGFLPRPSPASLRVMSYNVNWDSVFPDDDPQNHELRAFNRVAEFKRLLAAIQPDVICLQELNYLRSSDQVAELVAAAVGDGATWNAAKERDTFIVSRYPLATQGYEVVTSGVINALQQSSALVDLPDETYPTDLFVICSHFKAGGANTDILLRQEQADVLMSNIADALAIGGELTLPAETPYLLLGDFNIYDSDPHNHLWTMLRGDIYNEARYGHDFAPDWDATNLADAAPSHNGLGEDHYTWRDDAEGFAPGTFDRVLYTDSVLLVVNAFILDTTTLAAEILTAWGLQAGDVLLGGEPGFYDHLPLVVDFEITEN